MTKVAVSKCYLLEAVVLKKEDKEINNNLYRNVLDLPSCHESSRYYNDMIIVVKCYSSLYSVYATKPPRLYWHPKVKEDLKEWIKSHYCDPLHTFTELTLHPYHTDIRGCKEYDLVCQ